MKDLHELPKLADSLTYLYVEHAIVEQKQKGIEIVNQDGATLAPAAALTVLLLGPGTRITHAAVKSLADNGCAIVWVGEDGMRCYAHGGGETRKAYHLLHQARLVSDPALRLEVCKRMYRQRFNDLALDNTLDIQQLRGMEGARVRTAYMQASIRYGVEWRGRCYDRHNWGGSDPINNALSAANALLNGLCHAAIVSGGYSPALGFIHTGLQSSFVYDIADLYKVEITIPVAFRTVGASRERVQPRVREACRQAFKEARLLQRILPDIERLLAVPPGVLAAGEGADDDSGCPEPLWTPPIEEAMTCTDADAEARRLRQQRAVEGLQSGWTVRAAAPDVWNVITHPGSAGYTVRQVEGKLLCDCPDFSKTGLGMCKHTAAVELTCSADVPIRNDDLGSTHND
ncbi:MAG: type I-E CRISPR-associated endonuclease Cas1 [Anaerolineae bacterium]|nr:type I-E CRISPR-associated endonuclease Cas1 [Anaerolineae bacterium]